MSKAIWGGLMGLGQGISQYGSAVGNAAMRRAEAAEEFDRQTSLLEIRDRYQRTLEKEKYDPNSEIGGLMEAQRKRLLAEESDPNNPTYQMMEAQRLKVSEEKHAQDVELRQIKDSTGARLPSAIANTEYYAQLTPEQRAIFDRVNKISEQGALTEKDVAKSAIDLYTSFSKMDRLEKKAYLESLGIDPKTKGEALQKELIGKFKATIRSFAPETPGPLMGGTSGVGVPGSSPDNPIDGASLSGPPPSGTWVSYHGRVKRMP